MKEQRSVMELIKPGDIVLRGRTSFISKSIQYFMKKERKKLKLPVPKGLVASHAGMIVNLWNQLYIAEANANGVEVLPFYKTYGNSLDKIKVLSPKKPYTKEEQEEVSMVAIESSLHPTRYDFFGLLYQIKKVFSPKNKWTGPTGPKAERRMYCTEAVATWANKVRPRTFSYEEATNPVDVEMNRYYKIIYDGSEIE